MANPAAPTRLLLVLPDEAVRTFLRRRFNRLGHEVVEAGDHEVALALAERNAFDLALVDLQIPGARGEEGLDLVRRLRELRGPEALPILAIAEAGEGADAAEALEAGADDCLMRPLYADLAHARAEMLMGPRAEAPRARKGELQARLETLEDAAVRTEALSAALVELGLDAIAPINGLLGAAAALTAICRTPALKRPIERIEAAAAALDLVMVRALGRADRRKRAPKTKLSVLAAGMEADGRGGLQELLDAAEVEVELSQAAGGSQAVLVTDTRFFDLIVMSLDGPEEIAAIQAIRRAERQNRTRRTPILAVGAPADSAAPALGAGADLFMPAPVTAERLLGALADALTREAEEVRAVA
jgi:DNA-binding response OmpR family regulator